MFEHYLPNKNEGATVAPKSKFRELNKGSVIRPFLGYLFSDRKGALGSTHQSDPSIVSYGLDTAQ